MPASTGGFLVFYKRKEKREKGRAKMPCGAGCRNGEARAGHAPMRQLTLFERYISTQKPAGTEKQPSPGGRWSRRDRMRGGRGLQLRTVSWPPLRGGQGGSCSRGILLFFLFSSLFSLPFSLLIPSPAKMHTIFGKIQILSRFRRYS